MNRTDQLDSAYWPLRLTYGLVPLLAGLDKFFNLLADWPSYLSPRVASMLPVSVPTFMHVVGVVEMAVGLLVLTRFPRLGAYLAMGWLVLIAGNLLIAGHFDIAVRDVALAVGAFTLAKFVEAREAVPARRSQLATAATG